VLDVDDVGVELREYFEGDVGTAWGAGYLMRVSAREADSSS